MGSIFKKISSNKRVEESNIWLDGMMGLVVGDALGMPVQFVKREE